MKKLVRESLADKLRGPSREESIERLDNLSPVNKVFKAAEIGSFEKVKEAIEEDGANFHVLNEAPLRMACMKGHFDIVKYLVEKDADITSKHYAPLVLADSNGHQEIVDYLMKKVREAGIEIPYYDLPKSYR